MANRGAAAPSPDPIPRACVSRGSPLHVDDAGAIGPVAGADEFLERAVFLEDGVEVADEQHLRPGAGMFGDEMTRALKRGAVDPARLESQRVELRLEHFADFANARVITGTAVDVDNFLEERDAFVVVRVDKCGDGLFLICYVRVLYR